jgi:hypothetical protein
VNVNGGGRWRQLLVATSLEQLKPVLDGRVLRVKVGRARVGVNRVGNLVVARLVQAAEVVPYFRNVWVDADRTRVGVEGVAVLVDLEVENTNRAPECRVAAITVDGLLIRLVRLVVTLAGHERTAKKVPALGVAAVCLKALGEVGNTLFLVGKSGTGLRVQPAELLENLCVVRLVGQDTHVRFTSRDIVAIEFVNVAELEENVPRGQRTRGIFDNVFEALERVGVLALMLVNDTQSEIDFVCLFKVPVHFENAGEGLLGMLKGTVTVIQDANAVPKLWLLGVSVVMIHCNKPLGSRDSGGPADRQCMPLADRPS